MVRGMMATVMARPARAGHRVKTRTNIDITILIWGGGAGRGERGGARVGKMGFGVEKGQGKGGGEGLQRKVKWSRGWGLVGEEEGDDGHRHG